MATKKVSTKTPVKTAEQAEAVPAVDAVVDEEETESRVKGPTLRIKALLERVSETTGGKKKVVKEIVEATLSVIGDSLAKGEELNLPGIGRTRIARTSERNGASLMTLKIRRGAHKPKAAGNDAKVALAEDEDDS